MSTHNMFLWSNLKKLYTQMCPLSGALLCSIAPDKGGYPDNIFLISL